MFGKSVLIKVLAGSQFFRSCIFRIFNKIRLNNNELNVSNIHFRANTINIHGINGAISCDSESFLTGCVLNMSGNENELVVKGNSSIYGENRQTVYICGDNNHILIGANCNLRLVNFFIRGCGNNIIIEDDCSAYNVEFHIEQNGNTIYIGKGTTMHGRDGHAIHMAADEGSKIVVYEDCMLSHSVQIRSTDSHSIIDLNGKRLNPAKDIIIGSHCWIGMQSIILKGTVLQKNCIVAARGVCCKEYDESNCSLAGNPAKIVKREINWDRKFV